MPPIASANLFLLFNNGTTMSNLQETIEQAFEQRAEINPQNVDKKVKDAVNEAINLLDTGSLRVAEKKAGQWVVNQWLKKAVLLSFRIQDNTIIKDGYSNYFD